ncbi:MAG: hypothetical protein JWN70_5303 [Planctomycetaceae bacterium]|nr:hypothetical protein [Planctomycetaceae bacterium]
MDLKPLLEKILGDYSLPVNGLHGVAHWARVLENGFRVGRETGADLEIVSLFAVLHDSQRVNEGTDPDHGLRAANFATTLRGGLIDLSDHDFHLLYRACEGHTHERNHPDVTIQTCWDADRLDLGRVGISPHPSRLCTQYAKQSKTIRWADGRASFHVIPDLVRAEWSIDLS